MSEITTIYDQDTIIDNVDKFDISRTFEFCDNALDITFISKKKHQSETQKQNDAIKTDKVYKLKKSQKNIVEPAQIMTSAEFDNYMALLKIKKTTDTQNTSVQVSDTCDVASCDIASESQIDTTQSDGISSKNCKHENVHAENNDSNDIHSNNSVVESMTDGQSDLMTETVEGTTCSTNTILHSDSPVEVSTESSPTVKQTKRAVDPVEIEQVKRLQIETVTNDLKKSISATFYRRSPALYKLIPMIYHGQYIVDLCERLNISTEDIITVLQNCDDVKRVFNFDMFKKFLDVYLGKTVVDKKVDGPDRSSFIRSTYNRKDGFPVFKVEHIKYNKFSDIPISRNLNKSGICRCVVCMNEPLFSYILTDGIKTTLTKEFTENPFENILMFESRLFDFLTGHMCRHYIVMKKKLFDSGLDAITYINHVKNKMPSSDADEFYEHVKMVLGSSSIGKIAIDHRTKAHQMNKQEIEDCAFTLRSRISRLYLRYGEDNINIFNFIGLLSKYDYNAAQYPDPFGITPWTLMTLIDSEPRFMVLIRNLTEMLTMSLDLSDRWCMVDLHPQIKRYDETTEENDNFMMVVHHNIFTKMYHYHLAKKLYCYIVSSGYVHISMIDFLFNDFRSEAGVNNDREMYTMQRNVDNNKNLIVTFVNITDIFDKIDHSFIDFVMTQYKVPDFIKMYVKTFYSKLKARILINGEYSNYFKVNRGLLHGDELSNAIYLMCLNYIVYEIENKFCGRSPVKDKNIISVFSKNVLMIYTTKPRDTKDIIEELLRLNNALSTGWTIDLDRSYMIVSGDILKKEIKDGIVINDNKRKFLLKTLKQDEIIRYQKTSSFYQTERSDISNKDDVINEIINEIQDTDELIQKYSMGITVKPNIMDDYYKNRKGNDAQSLYNYLMKKIEWNLVNMAMHVETFFEIITKVSKVCKYYSTKWNVKTNQIYSCEIYPMGMKHIIQTHVSAKNPSFNKNMESHVWDLYVKTGVPPF